MCIVPGKQKVLCTHKFRSQLEQRSRCTAILVAGINVSSFAVIKDVGVAHICMSALCLQQIRRHYTRSVSKHGRCAACAGSTYKGQCNPAGLL
jgi:hypothetical protein